MSHKPSLTRALDTATDIARQIGRDPAVKEATADLLQHVGRKLADKADQGANQLRARNPVDVPVGQPGPSLGKSARRVGVALADAMVRSSASREKAGRHAARPTPQRHGDIENAIRQHAEATYQRVMARFEDHDEASLRHDLPVSPAEAEEDARAWAQVAEQGSSLLASAIGAPVAGASPASRDRRSELPGDDHWHEEPR